MKVDGSRAVTRRGFLGQMLVAGVACQVVPRRVLGGNGLTPPSEQLTRAIIGCGGISASHLPMDYGRLLALCDVDANNLKNRMQGQAAEVKGYRDFREVLDRPDIDVVHICTPPHWHGLISVLAARAGKDIWCEKPMTRTIGEGRKVVEAVQRHGRIFRINTWFRFQSQFYDFGSTVREIKKIVNSGMLGWPLRATVGTATGFAWKHGWCGKPYLPPQPVPPQLDYDLWLGPAPYKPYNPDRVHARFRGYWDYDGGGLGDMGQHYLDPMQYLLGKDDTSPVSVEAEAPVQHSDAVGLWRRVSMKYADGCELILDGDDRDRRAPFLEGPGGKLFRGLESTIPGLRQKLASLPEPAPQQVDFGDSVRRRRTFALNEANAHRSCTLVNLAKVAVRMGRGLRFDPVAQRVVDDEAANRLLDEPMRAPWTM